MKIKNLPAIIVSIGLGLLAPCSNAQAQKEISIGFRAGYANTFLHGREVQYQRRYFNNFKFVEKDGFEVATTVYYQVFKPIFITSGLGFIQKGGALENTTALYPLDVTLNYINVPIGIAFRPIQGDKFSVFIEGGLIMNYEVSSNQEFKKGITGFEDSKFIVSYCYGGSLRYKLNERISLQGDLRFLGDLNAFYVDTRNDGFTGNQEYPLKTKGKTVSLGVVYRWR
jgi:hypothetical protein